MKFETLEVALQLSASMGPVLSAVARRDRDLGRQMRRAVVSVPSNLAEGAHRRGKDQVHHYRIAAGSAAELGVQLRMAQGWGHVGTADAAEELLDRVRAMLWRLTHPR